MRRQPQPQPIGGQPWQRTPTGAIVYRWRIDLAFGRSVITWAEDRPAAIVKLWRTRGALLEPIAIVPAAAMIAHDGLHDTSYLVRAAAGLGE